MTVAFSRMMPAEGERRLYSATSDVPGCASASWNGRPSSRAATSRSSSASGRSRLRLATRSRVALTRSSSRTAIRRWRAPGCVPRSDRALPAPRPRRSTRPPSTRPRQSSPRGRRRRSRRRRSTASATRSGPGAPARTSRATSALRSGDPERRESSGAGSTPSSSGVTEKASTRPSLTSITRVSPDTLISSSPSTLDTTKPLRHPRAASAEATVSSLVPSETPITWRVAPAGLVNGPRKLNSVRTASSLRTGTTCLMAAWCSGANMKPKPISSMHSAIAAGSSSSCAPSASSRSADPDWPVLERPPCLATAQPAPAATMAAVVDTLNVGRPPPVPQVSSRSSRSTTTLRDRSRIVRAKPVSSSTVSPLARSAIRKAAIWTSDARPSITSRMTSAASSTERSIPEASLSTASVRTGFGISSFPRGSSAAGACPIR